jgi:hypothetical protein
MLGIRQQLTVTQVLSLLIKSALISIIASQDLRIVAVRSAFFDAHLWLT